MFRYSSVIWLVDKKLVTSLRSKIVNDFHLQASCALDDWSPSKPSGGKSARNWFSSHTHFDDGNIADPIFFILNRLRWPDLSSACCVRDRSLLVLLANNVRDLIVQILRDVCAHSANNYVPLLLLTVNEHGNAVVFPSPWWLSFIKSNSPDHENSRFSLSSDRCNR